MLYRPGCNKFVTDETYFINEKSKDPNGPRTTADVCFYFRMGGGVNAPVSSLGLLSEGLIRLGKSEYVPAVGNERVTF